MSVEAEGQGEEGSTGADGEGSVDGRWGHSESEGPGEDVLPWCLLAVTKASCPSQGREATLDVRLAT